LKAERPSRVDSIKKTTAAVSLTIELREEEQATLSAKARAHGMAPEEYARQV
jgi:hypothetical protein